MKRFKKKIVAGGITAIVVVGLMIVIYGVSWIVTCGLIKLVCMCFGLTFTWKIATGIWIVLAILQSVFKTTVNKN